MPIERFQFTGSGGQHLAATLDLPEQEPVAYALFAHCFTCGKDVLAAKRIAVRLAAQAKPAELTRNCRRENPMAVRPLRSSDEPMHAGQGHGRHVGDDDRAEVGLARLRADAGELRAGVEDRVVPVRGGIRKRVDLRHLWPLL